MNLGVFVLGLEQDELDKCGAGERSLYHFIGLGFWVFLGLAAIAGGINLYYIDDHFLSIAIGAILFPVLLGFLFRILLLSVKRPPRFFLQKWYLRMLPDLGSVVRLVIVTILTLLIAMPLSGILQYHRVERVAEEKARVTANYFRSFESKFCLKYQRRPWTERAHALSCCSLFGFTRYGVDQGGNLYCLFSSFSSRSDASTVEVSAYFSLPRTN